MSKEIIDPAQAAWAQYVSKLYLDRNSIMHAHEAFITGYWTGRQAGLQEAEHAKEA